MTIAELDERMTAREFFQWMEYAREEPLQSDRIELMLAQLMSLTYNVNAKDTKAPMDFFVSLSEEEKKAQKQAKTDRDLMGFLRSQHGSR